MSVIPSAQELTSLLDAIRTEARLQYLSDLHATRYRGEVYAAIGRIQGERFRPTVWRMAARYILGDQPELEQTADARKYLLNMLQSSSAIV